MTDAKVFGCASEKCRIRNGSLVSKSIQIHWIDRRVCIFQIAFDGLVQRIQECSITEQILESTRRLVRHDARAIQIEIAQLFIYYWQVVLIVRRDFHQFW